MNNKDFTDAGLMPGNSGRDCLRDNEHGCDECHYLACCLDENYPECCTDCTDSNCPRKTI